VTDRSDLLDQVVTRLQEPVALDPKLERRVMDAVLVGPPPRSWPRPLWAAAEWLRRPQTVRVSPLRGLALAAGLALLWIAADQFRTPTDPGAAVVASSGTVVQFVIVAPDANGVSLVGDFNDWTSATTPMSRASGNGVWSVTVPLDPGRYRYAFLVDGEVWLRDPSAPPVQDDEFGRPGSVVTVGET